MRLVCTLVVLCLVGAAARAESPRVSITSARVGLPDARNADQHIVKFGAWAPLEVELTGTEGFAEPLELRVETADADGVMTVLALPLKPGPRASGFIRPAAGGGETTVTVWSGSNTISEPYRIRNLRPKDPLSYVVLTIGSRVPNFDLPRPTEGETNTGPIRGGRIQHAAIDDVSRLPGSWIGYDSADLVILATSSPEFMKQLLGADRKLAALREWVSRGGRLVVSAGSNAASLNNPQLVELLPAAFERQEQVPSLPLYWSARESGQTTSLTGNLAAKSGAFPIARFKPKPGTTARIVVPPASRPTELKDSVAVQAPFGLGRVTLIGFDLDQAPFTNFARQPEFWDWVLREGGASRASVGSEGKPRVEAAAPTDDEDEATVALRTHADTFEAVPVTSFSSVAFLIVLYILLIGPVEYWFLKRILGRLELTWITFPLIVVTVCVAAMLSASAMKGKDLRANKIDVIDVSAGFDPRTGSPSGTVHGSTWFTLFSPKIDVYSPRVLPAEGWVKERERPTTLVGWSGSPRAGRASLLQRRYEYHSDPAAIADGLDGVPVQVWSTKSFSADWLGEIDPASPVVESRLVHPVGDSSRVIGTFVNRMPFEAVTDCVAFYAGQAYAVGTILSGQEVRLVLERGQPATQWLQERGQLGELLGRGQAGVAATAGTKLDGPKPVSTAPSTHLPLWGLLFHEASLRNEDNVIPRNATLRRLDQSWRLAPDNRTEVIVVGRVLPPHGTIDEAFNGKESPSRLLLKGGQSLPGYARQETYVRLYLKVK